MLACLSIDTSDCLYICDASQALQPYVCPYHADHGDNAIPCIAMVIVMQ